MTADQQPPGPVAPAQWDTCEDQPVERTPEEKARILARLQCMLAQLRASNGGDHGNT
jgi:hypothetical protein